VSGGAANPRAGRAFERRCLDILRTNGYWAMGSPGSRGAVDAVAIKAPYEVLFIQCKRHGRLSSAEWNALYELAVRIGAVPLLADNPARGVTRFRRLARARAVADHGRAPLEDWAVDLLAVEAS
jgi:Holliday junction resolvase